MRFLTILLALFTVTLFAADADARHCKGKGIGHRLHERRMERIDQRHERRDARRGVVVRVQVQSAPCPAEKLKAPKGK